MLENLFWSIQCWYMSKKKGKKSHNYSSWCWTLLQQNSTLTAAVLKLINVSNYLGFSHKARSYRQETQQRLFHRDQGWGRQGCPPWSNIACGVANAVTRTISICRSHDTNKNASEIKQLSNVKEDQIGTWTLISRHHSQKQPMRGHCACTKLSKKATKARNSAVNLTQTVPRSIMRCLRTLKKART